MRLKYIFVILAILFIIPLVIAAKPRPVNPCPITSTTNIVFYGETGFGGVGTLSRSWIIHFLDWWKTQDPSINYVELDSSDVKTDCNLANFPNLKLYIQPGGDAYKQQNKLDSAGRTNILNLINSGKAFMGICAGFYYAANDYYWQDTYYNHPYVLDIYPTVEGSIREIADYDGNPDYALTSLSNGFNAIYYGGPTRGYEYTPLQSPGEFVTTFTEYGNGMPALIKYNNLLLSSVHLEAFENDGITGLSTTDRIENYKLLANSLNEVSLTNFYVPPYANPPICGNNIKEIPEVCDNADLSSKTCETLGFDSGTLSCLSDCSGFDTSSCITIPKQCSDGIDNDNDSLTDFPLDPGCISGEDNDETDVIGPATIFSDDFESGTLSSWTTTALSGSNFWTNSITNPSSGTRHAQAQPMSTSEPASVLEKSISTLGHTNIMLSYYRRLIGLDSADEFKVSWFDGMVWNTLEQTGSNSANDAAYIKKEFALSSTANDNPNLKVRFECTSGAVSEFCRIDDFLLTSN